MSLIPGALALGVGVIRENQLGLGFPTFEVFSSNFDIYTDTLHFAYYMLWRDPAMLD